jgi:hypothetical protein
LRVVLYCQIARQYLPSPQANLVRVVINGESWGIYVNAQTFSKEFVKDWFGTTKGARWKVPGSPGGRGSLAYLGDEAAPYRRIYQLQTRDNPKSWAALITLCKVLNETPAGQLEAALAPLLDIDGALKFLALENTLINNDGYWIRTSDYSLYQDTQGRFHILAQDLNETFSRPGGPGFGGGPGGPGGFGPGVMVALQMLEQGDKDGDRKLAQAEFAALAEAWFDKLDPDKSGKVSQQQFSDRLSEVLPPPQGFGPPGGGPPGGGRGFGPGRFLGPGLFTAVDTDKDGSLTRIELKGVFNKWASAWDSDKSGLLSEDKLRQGLAAVLPRPNFGRGGGPGGAGGRGFGGPVGPGFGGGQRVTGVELDPLLAANDPNKPLISRLLAVPSLRARYLGYVRDIAEKWLDWNKLGPLAQQCHALIADDVKADTRKLDTTEAFLTGLTGDTQGPGGFRGPGGGSVGLKSFVEQRQKYLLNLPALKQARR